MRFPPIKADRGLLWITLVPDDTVAARYAALRALLKTCRLHPLDTTPSAELVIIDPEAVRARRADLLAVLGQGDTLHLITQRDGRLSVEVLAAGEVLADGFTPRPPDRQPPWLRD